MTPDGSVTSTISARNSCVRIVTLQSSCKDRMLKRDGYYDYYDALTFRLAVRTKQSEECIHNPETQHASKQRASGVRIAQCAYRTCGVRLKRTFVKNARYIMVPPQDLTDLTPHFRRRPGIETFESAARSPEFKREDAASCLILDVRLRGENGLTFEVWIAVSGITVR